MVGVAQLAEHQVVALRVVGSSPITHPIKLKGHCTILIMAMAFVACAPVAQLDRAPDFESVGRPFESGRAYHKIKGLAIYWLALFSSKSAIVLEIVLDWDSR